MRHLRFISFFCTLLIVVGLLTLVGGEEKTPFKVEITTKAGRVLEPGENFSLVGIEQTLLAKVTPAIDGAEYEWTIGAPVLRTYEHDIQIASKHKPIALDAKDRSGPKVSFYWTKPQDSVEVSVRVRRGAEQQTAKVAFTLRLPRDPNRDIYSYADDDPIRNPNGLSATYASSKSHRNWHLGQHMSDGELPVFSLIFGSETKTLWGDLGSRNDPARLFGLDYNGVALLQWHGSFLNAQRAWRRTFHIPDYETDPPHGGLPIEEYLKRVPDEKSASQSRLYGYVRMGEYQNLDQLGKDAVHPWHNRGHTGISRWNREPRMDDQAVSPPARDDFFFRWHTIVEEVGLAFGPDQATVATKFPEEGATVTDGSSVFVAFDKKVSANGPASNTIQFAAGKVMVNGKPATTVTDIGGQSFPFTIYQISGFPTPDEGPVKVDVAGTLSYKGASWSFTLKKGPKPAASAAEEFQRMAGKVVQAARAQQAKADVERILPLFKAADADDHWIGYIFRLYPIPPEEGVPLLVKLLDHPSHHIVGHAVQTLQYHYGPNADAATPKLVEMLNDKVERPWWVRERIARALGVVGRGTPQVIAALMTSIKNKAPSEPVNRGSIEALGRIGPAATEALPLLRKQLVTLDPEAQFDAFAAIGKIVQSDRPSLHNLKSLRYVDWRVADSGYAVFRAIQDAGPAAAFTVPALVETFRRDPPLSVKGMVIETLGSVEAGDAEAVNILVNALPARWETPGDSPGEKFLSDRAREALDQVSPSDPQAVLVLAKGLGHSDPFVRLQAALTLRRYKAKGAPAVPALVEALKQADAKTLPHQIGAYLDALRAIGPDARAAGDTLVEFLSERSPIYRNREKFYAHYLRAWFLLTLADTEVPASAKPCILDFLNNSDKTMAQGYAAAARAAARFGPEMPEAIPGLIRSLKPDFPDFVMSFDFFGIALGYEDVSCRREALKALAKMGPKAAEAVPLITKLAKEKPDGGSVVPRWDEEAAKTLRALRVKD